MQKDVSRVKQVLTHPITILFIFMLFQLLIRVQYVADDGMFSTDSYFHIRQIEYIKTHGTIMHDDNYSFFNKLYFFTPLYHYLLAILLTFMSKYIVFKIVPIILSLLTIPATYLLAKEMLTKKKYIYLTAFFVGFLPGVLITGTNTVSPMNLFLPVVLFFLYALQRLRYSLKYQYLLLFSSVIAALTHPMFILFVLGIYVLFFIQYITGRRILKAHKEFLFFITLFCVWLYGIVFKKYFKIYGVTLLTQNLPKTLRGAMFPELSISLILSAISIVIIIAAVFAIYKEYAKGDPQKIELLFAMSATILLAMYLKVLAFGLGVIVISVLIINLAAVSFESLERYMERTYVAWLKHVIYVFIVILMAITIIVPSLYHVEHSTTIITDSEYKAFLWMKEYSKQEAVVFVAPRTGQAEIYFAKRKSFFDDMFLGFPNLDEINQEIINTATYEYGLESLGMFNNVDYIIETPRMTNYLGSRFMLDEKFSCMKEVQEFGSKEDLSYARIIFNQCELSK